LKKEIRKVIIFSLVLGILLFILRIFICKPASLYGFYSAISEIISVTLFLLFIYVKYLWIFNPLEKLPKLKKKYNGIIKYKKNENIMEKKIKVFIKQTLLNISIKIKTDEMNSISLNGYIVLENEEYILYYTYITNPKSEFSQNNPIQYGTCRLTIDSVLKFNGNYWNSRGNIGDIYLNMEDPHAQP